ncbi:MAG: pentapeptide repeat-containing protein [Egibacteraceae bacterium]
MPERNRSTSTPVDLPALTALEGELAPNGDYDACALDGLDLRGQRADRARLTQSRVREYQLDDVSLRDALIAECIFERVDAVSFSTVGATWRDVALSWMRMGNFEAYDADLTRVTVRESRFGFVNLRSARLTDVLFDRCVITDLDLGSATARRVTFAGCRFERVDCFQADLEDVDLRGAEAGEVVGVGHLRGTVMSPSQLVALAPAMAAHLGVTMRDDEEALK